MTTVEVACHGPLVVLLISDLDEDGGLITVPMGAWEAAQVCNGITEAIECAISAEVKAI